jgi:ligand-binding SRPBCC domain-containing protein
MPVINLVTEIHAPIERCFDLCRDLEAHTRTVAYTKERLVGDKKTGLAELGDVLVFEAVHFGIRQRLSSEITEMVRPALFADIALSGAFQSLYHRHEFTEMGGRTLMRDRLKWTSPLGLLGRLADSLFLKRHMLRFLVTRNRNLKAMIEAG